MDVEPFDTALFIPDNLTGSFQEEARRQVGRSWSNRPARFPASAARSRATVPHCTQQQRVCITVAIVMALTGLGLCTAWWTNLAIETRSPTWTTLCLAGGAVWVIGTAVALSFRLPPDEGGRR